MINMNKKPLYSQISIDVRYFEDINISKVLKDLENKLMNEYGKLAVIASDTIDMNEQYADLTTDELCGNCGAEVKISANGYSVCPECGKPIYPCSMCGDCGVDCPYKEH